jgi:hypothetical protein
MGNEQVVAALEGILEAPVHSAAASRMPAEAEALTSLDVSPLASDRGHDAWRTYLDKRRADPTLRLEDHLRSLCHDFRVVYDDRLLASETLERQLVKDGEGELDFREDVYTLDESILASALAHALVTGSVDAGARPWLSIALRRQSSPLVLQRLFGSGPQRRRVLDAIATLLDVPLAAAEASPRPCPAYRLYPPSVAVLELEGPPVDPQTLVKELLAGGLRKGGVTTSPAGNGHEWILHALMWRLWEAGFSLQHFDEIYFLPTAKLPHGSYECPAGSEWFREVRIGVDPARLRAICRGEATMDGVDLFGGAVVELARTHGLDVGAAERARARLREHGLVFEVLLRCKRFDGFELRAYVATHATSRPEIVVERRDAEGVRRAATTTFTGDPALLATDLRIAKGMIELVPLTRAHGARVRVPVAQLRPA